MAESGEPGCGVTMQTSTTLTEFSCAIDGEAGDICYEVGKRDICYEGDENNGKNWIQLSTVPIGNRIDYGFEP